MTKPETQDAEREAIARIIADGFTNGNEQFDEATKPQQDRYLMAADAILSRPHSNTKAAEPDPQSVSDTDLLPEPVAWRYRTQNSAGAWSMWTVTSERPWSDIYNYQAVPLYAAPQAPDSAASDTGADAEALFDRIRRRASHVAGTDEYRLGCEIIDFIRKRSLPTAADAGKGGGRPVCADCGLDWCGATCGRFVESN